MKTKTAMLVLSAAAMLSTTTLVLAGPPGWAPAYGYRDRDARGYEFDRDRHAHRIPARPVYYDARPPVYVVPPVAYAPAPYYGATYATPVYNDNVFGTVAGAAVGALIGNQIGRGGNREAATAIGAVVGAAIGGSMR